MYFLVSSNTACILQGEIDAREDNFARIRGKGEVKNIKTFTENNNSD